MADTRLVNQSEAYNCPKPFSYLTEFWGLSYCQFMAKEEKVITFEMSVKELESLVSELEKGETSLESQLKSFEKGVSLARQCMKQLEEVEKRVEILVKNSEGKLTSTPFTETP